MNLKTDSPYADFGEVLRWYRKKAGFSQEQLAEGICTREYIRLIEKEKKNPTIYMIDAFSKKTGINLFDAYALIISHHDFDTHMKIEALNEALHMNDDERLFALATKYASLPGFSSGVPLQIIKYSFSLYYSNVLQDYDKSIQYATEGLSVSGITSQDMVPSPLLNIIDMSLLLVKGVDLCRSGNYAEGKKHLQFLHECARLRIEENRYIANRNRRIDINMFALSTYNICEFFPDDAENNIPLLDNSISLLNDYKCSNCLSSLLLYKSAYLYNAGKEKEAKRFFSAGYNLLSCMVSVEKADNEAQKILGDKYHLLKTGD